MLHHHPLRAAAAAALLLLVPLIARATDTPPTAHDIASMASVGDVRMSPDGSTILYRVVERRHDSGAEVDPDDEMGGWEITTRLFTVPVEGGTPRPMLPSSMTFSMPRWSPDGTRIAFLAKNADGSRRIHVMPADGSEPAEPVGSGAVEPGWFAWSPSGDRFAVIAPDPATDEQRRAEWERGGAYEYESQWAPDRLWTLPADGGMPTRVELGGDHVVDAVWSPDGSMFAVLLANNSDPYYVWSLRTAYVVSAETGERLHELDGAAKAIDHIGWSPDGRRVAWEAGEGTLSLLNALRVYDLNSRRSVNVAEGLDLTLDGHLWVNGGQAILAHTLDRVHSALYRLEPDGSTAQKLGRPERGLHGPFSADGSGSLIACESSTPHDPPAVTVLDASAPLEARLIADPNPQADSWPTGDVRLVHWVNPVGVELEGVLHLPPTLEEGEVAPLMVLPHGGPDGVSRLSWYRWGAYFAARGYTVFRPNYRGGIGYGFDFYAANRAKLGEVEFTDIESGVDHLLEEGLADPERLVFGGWSWGGYITAWTIGHTDRYRAAVVGAGVSDVTAMYALSDINHGAAARWEYKGNPWRQRETFDASSPIRFIENASTPTLILHGKQDRRVPASLGLILYRALVDLGVEVDFYLYPREPHGPREPAHTQHYLSTWSDWYDRHLNR